MNGIHDMGGMQGAGPVAPENDEPVFHEQWEKDVFAIQIAASCQGLYNRDEFRHAIERMNWRQYLESSYYEHWLTALETLLSEKGIIGTEELEARVKLVKGKKSSEYNPTFCAPEGKERRHGEHEDSSGNRSQSPEGDCCRYRTRPGS